MWHDDDMSPLRHIVLVHGAWHGAWCFSALQSELDRRGVPSYAIDLPGHGASTEPLGGFTDDVEAVRRFVAVLADRGITDPVLVGHSYGGAVVSAAAAESPPVDSLVYLAAFALHQGESVLSAMSTFPRHEVALGAAIRIRDDGTSVLDPLLAGPALYGSCSRTASMAAIERLTPQPMATMAAELTSSALGRVRSTYVICSEDRAVHPVHQCIMAERCTNSITLKTDHSPFVSMVTETADILENCARRP